MFTFSQALATLPAGEKPALLMGNGFSQAWSSKIFNYRSIFDNANFGEHDALIKGLFKELNTFDFESVMDRLNYAGMILRHYDPESDVLPLINKHQEALKKALINAISSSHPTYPHEITDEQFTCVRAFLSKFKGLFTLNYDLLMYWQEIKKSCFLRIIIRMMVLGLAECGSNMAQIRRFFSCMVHYIYMSMVR